MPQAVEKTNRVAQPKTRCDEQDRSPRVGRHHHKARDSEADQVVVIAAPDRQHAVG